MKIKKLSFVLLCIASSLGQMNAEKNENFFSVAFDGNWGINKNCAINLDKKNYFSWIDCYGNIHVGYVSPADYSSSSTMIKLDRKFRTDNTILSMTSVSGNPMIAIAEKYSKKVTVISLDTKPDVTNKLVLNIEDAKNVDYMNLMSDGKRAIIIARDSDRNLYKTVSENGKDWGKPELVLPELNRYEGDIITKYENEKLIVAINGKSPLIVYSSDNKIYNVENKSAGTWSKLKKGFDKSVAGLKSIKDVSISNNGVINILGSTDKEPCSLMTYDGKKWNYEKLPVKGNASEMIFSSYSKDVAFATASNDSIYEILKLEKQNSGEWTAKEVTNDSKYSNYSITPIKNAKENEPNMAWVMNTIPDSKVNPLTCIKINTLNPEITDVMSEKDIKELTRKVMDWQLSNPFTKKSRIDWHWGTFYIGLMTAYEMTGDQRYLDEMINVGEYNNWKIEPNILNADRITITDMYIRLYERFKRPEMIKPTKAVYDLLASRTGEIPMSFSPVNKERFEWWTWADALYMAPPAMYRFANVTNDDKYRQTAYRGWIANENHLYSKEDSLFYRDDTFIPKKTTNGKKVFWARGNGWVVGALVRILQVIPENNPQREHFLNLYREMCAKLLRIQLPDGLWTVSLDDPQELLRGETSGSVFYGYAFAWGINNGILDKATYSKAAVKAWKALCKNVNEAGRLGFVQQVAGGPYPFFANQWQVYASGTFGLFANEILKSIK